MPDPLNAELIGAFCDTTKRIVVISPFPARLQPLLAELTIRCYDVLVFRHGQETVLSSMAIDLLIADRTIDGIDPLEELPDWKGSTLVLRGKNPPEAPIKGAWELWPGPVDQLMARIEELAGKSLPQVSSDELVFKDVRIDLRRILVYHNEQRIELTKTEFDLLRTLMAADGGVLTRQELMGKLWGDEYFGGSNSIDVHIKSLRRKLSDDPKDPRYIVTVRGVGYRMAD